MGRKFGIVMPALWIAQQFLQVTLSSNRYQIRERKPPQLAKTGSKFILILPEPHWKAMPLLPRIPRLIPYQGTSPLEPVHVAQDAPEKHYDDLPAGLVEFHGGTGNFNKHRVFHVDRGSQHSVFSGERMHVLNEYECDLESINTFPDSTPINRGPFQQAPSSSSRCA